MTSTQSDIDNHLSDAFNRSEQLTIVPVLKLIYITTGIDLYKEYKLEYPLSSNKSKDIKHGEIIINNKIKLFLDIVDSDYDLTNGINNSNLLDTKVENFNDIDDKLKKQLIDIISYISHSCLLVFNNIKSNYKELTEYHLTMADNTTIYLDFENKKRLGVMFSNIEN
jgi:hypothetical protein